MKPPSSFLPYASCGERQPASWRKKNQVFCCHLPAAQFAYGTAGYVLSRSCPRCMGSTSPRQELAAGTPSTLHCPQLLMPWGGGTLSWGAPLLPCSFLCITPGEPGGQ